MKTMLKCVPDETRLNKRFWLHHHTRIDTVELARELRVWQEHQQPPLLKSAKDKVIFGDDYDFAMIMPEPHVAPKTAQKLLGNNKDFAIPMPTTA